MSKTVAIAGGGLAGLSAAVFLAQEGFQVEIYESSPKLGGRAYSFYDKGKELFFDNGQHLLAGWYRHTFEYLKIIGTYEQLKFQKNLEIDFVNTSKQMLKLRTLGLKPPFNLLSGLISFPGFTVKEKLSLLKLKALMKAEVKGTYSNAAELLESLGQSGNLMKYFWEPFIFAVFNTTAKNVNRKIFENVMRKGLSDEMGFMLVLPKLDLNKVFIDPAVNFLEKKGCRINLGIRIVGADFSSGENHFVIEGGNKIKADYFVSALPFFEFPEVIGKSVNALKNNGGMLRTSSIVSVHFFLNHNLEATFLPKNELGMTGLIGTRVQWVFKKSEKYFSMVISGADELGITGMSNDEIAELCITDLETCFDEFKRNDMKDCKVIREKRATFIPDNQSMECRPSQKTKFENVFVAGDWTETGLPSTIEGAILSAMICKDHILSAEGI